MEKTNAKVIIEVEEKTRISKHFICLTRDDNQIGHIDIIIEEQHLDDYINGVEVVLKELKEHKIQLLTEEVKSLSKDLLEPTEIKGKGLPQGISFPHWKPDELSGIGVTAINLDDLPKFVQNVIIEVANRGRKPKKEVDGS